MTQNKGSHQNSGFPMGFFLALIAIAIVLVFLIDDTSSNKEKKSSTPNHQSDIEKMRRVNQHLKLTDKRMQMEREKTQLDNMGYAPNVSKPNIYGEKPQWRSPGGIDLESEFQGRDTTQIIRGDEQDVSLRSPEDEIRYEMERIREDHRYNAESKRAFIREYIENAKRAGYEVIITEDLVVIGVKPIRQPTSQYPY